MGINLLSNDLHKYTRTHSIYVRRLADSNGGAEVYRNPSQGQCLDRSLCGGRDSFSWDSGSIFEASSTTRTRQMHRYSMQSVQAFEGSPHKLLERDRWIPWRYSELWSLVWALQTMKSPVSFLVYGAVNGTGNPFIQRSRFICTVIHWINCYYISLLTTI